MTFRGIASFVFCLGVVQAESTRTQMYPPPTQLKITGIAGDSQGLLWLATKSGIYRFDGARYVNVQGYPFASADHIAVGPEGTVWAGGPKGLARFRNAEWKVVLQEPVESMEMSSAGLWVSSSVLRLISADEQRKEFPGVHPTGKLQVDTAGDLWFICGEDVCTMRHPEWRVETRPAGAKGLWDRVIPEKGGKRYWLSAKSAFALIDDRIERERHGENLGLDYKFSLEPILAPDGRIWLLRSLRPEKTILPAWDTKPTGGWISYFPDASTRWFANDAMLCKSILDPDWALWFGGQLTSFTPQGFVKRQSGTFAAYTTRGIVEQNKDSMTWERVAGDGKLSVRNMVEDGLGGYWATTLDEGLVRLGRDFRILERFPKLCASIDTLRGLLHDGQGRTWVGGKDTNCFFEVKGGPGKWTFVPQKLAEPTYQTVELQMDPDGRPWVGYHLGIAYLDDNGKWQHIRTSSPVDMIRTMAFEGKDIIWVSHRRDGPFSRLERKGDLWQVRSFMPEQYGSADTQFVRVDSRGWIWRGTGTGVYVARPGHLEPGDWLLLTNRNGMASRGVTLRGWGEDREGNIWLGGDLGITRLRPSAKWFQAPAGKSPLITRVRVGGKEYLEASQFPEMFSLSEGGIEIDLGTIDANPFRPSSIRYRIGGEWKESSDGRLQFDALPAGSYQLEAAYTGEGDPPVLRWRFQIGHSIWWKALAWVLAVAGVGAAAWGWRRREYLQYWLRKRAFLIRRRVESNRGSEDLTWTNYQGITLAKRYKLHERITISEMAATYLGTDTVTERRVVVKVLHRNPGSERSMRIRFAHEVAALRTLADPGVVQLLDSWITEEGEACLAMPYLEGPTLRSVLKADSTLAPVRAAAILEKLGRAVTAMHQRGIVHRDLKPENVIILNQNSAEEQPVVIDLGSSAAKGPQHQLEETTTVTGSLHYLAPERLAGQYSPASDVFSLGVIALELFTGVRPAEMAMAPSATEFVVFVAAYVGTEAAETIAAALRHQPSLRPQEAVQWAADLGRAVREFSAHGPDVPPST